MTYKFACLNSISPIGLKNFTNKYEQVSDPSEANVSMRSQEPAQVSTTFL